MFLAMLPYLIDLTDEEEEEEEQEQCDKSTQTVEVHSQIRHFSTHFLTCPICLESMGSSFGRIVVGLKCCHVICDCCLIMLKRPKKCPICRHPIRQNGTRQLFI